MHLNTEIVLRQKMALRSKGIKSEIILEGIVFKNIHMFVMGLEVTLTTNSAEQS